MLSVYFQQCEENCNIYQFLLALYEQNPLSLLYFIFGVLLVGFIIVFVAGIIQGRGFSLWGLRIDPRLRPLISSEMDIDEITEIVSKKMSGEALRKEDFIFATPVLSERVIYIYAARHYIRRKITNIILENNGWAGISMASFDTFFTLARDHQLISLKLAEDINEFIIYTRSLLMEDNIPDDVFQNIQTLYTLIKIQLDEIPPQTFASG
jgi:hypothetical protein